MTDRTWPFGKPGNTPPKPDRQHLEDDALRYKDAAENCLTPTGRLKRHSETKKRFLRNINTAIAKLEKLREDFPGCGWHDRWLEEAKALQNRFDIKE